MQCIALTSTATTGDTGRCLEVEQFAKTFCLGAADGYLGVLGVVHAELVAGFEPGHDLADVLDVDDEGAVGSPEGLRVELIHEFFEGSAVGMAFDGWRDDADRPVLDGGEADLFLVDEQQAALGADDDLAGLPERRLSLLADEAEERVELGLGPSSGADGGSSDLPVSALAGLLDGADDATRSKGLSR